MPPITSKCPEVIISNGNFVLKNRAEITFRGINLGGSSKIPSQQVNFFDGKNVSFVDRPFSLEDAPEHFRRLERWGINLIRFVITWEAIEHEGPGIYDRSYLKYVRLLLSIASQYGIYVIIDPHQDVWSRWTGGDGAPQWTLELIGLNSRSFSSTCSAFCQQTFAGAEEEFPKMIWPTNYFKMACATMFTLFFGGNKYATKCKVKDIPIQDYLQSHYINAIAELCKELKDLPNILGYGTMNEPSPGFINVKDLSDCFCKNELKYGFCPTPYQGILLAAGFSEKIPYWGNGILRQHILGIPDSYSFVNTTKEKAWLPNFECIWKSEGIYRINSYTETAELLLPHYFAEADFGKDFYLPFAKKFASKLREIVPKCMIFIELPPLEFGMSSFPKISKEDISNVVNATHWYDGVTLFTRTWRPYFSVDTLTRKPVFGVENVFNLHKQQLDHIKNDLGTDLMDRSPTIIGECGIPFNLKGTSYLTGDFSLQIEALDHTISCLEHCNLSFTLWCYTSDNNNQLGDLWNCEDLSVFSEDQRVDGTKEYSDPDAGGRALEALVRPYANIVSGVVDKMQFNRKTKTFLLEFHSIDSCKTSTSQVFIPKLQYPMGFNIFVSDGTFSFADDKNHENGFWRLLYHSTDTNQFHLLRITTKDFMINSNTGFNAFGVTFAVVLVIAIIWFYVLIYLY